jgi:hypothetical protein
MYLRCIHALKSAVRSVRFTGSFRGRKLFVFVAEIGFNRAHKSVFYNQKLTVHNSTISCQLEPETAAITEAVHTAFIFSDEIRRLAVDRRSLLCV